MNNFRFITCLLLSYFSAFTNFSFSQCEVTITNTQCRSIGIFNEADSLLAFISRAPSPNSPLGPPAPWTDPIPLAENETRIYTFKEANFVLAQKSVTCENNEIDTSNPYADGCQNGVRLGTYINTGCRTMRMVGTSGNVLELLAPGDSVMRHSLNIIYIFMVGNDTIDIKSSEGDIFNIDSGNCETTINDCFATIFNTQCRVIGVFNEADSLLTTMGRGPAPNGPPGVPTPEWTDPIPLADDETRTYILKENNFILTRKTVNCANNEIDTSNPFATGCQDGLSQGVYTNTGCRELTMVNTFSEVISVLASGESITRTSTNFIYIFLARNDTIAIKSDENGLIDIDSGECIGADYEFSGNAFIDANTTCLREAAEQPLTGLDIIIRSFPSGETFETSTDDLGNYFMRENILFTDTIFEIGYASDLNLGQQCGTTFFIRKSADELGIQQDFAINLIENCPKIAVDIGAVRLRRCFTNTYFVNYFNYSTADVEDVSIEVRLDPFLSYQNSSVLANVKENNTFEFQIGRLQSGESGQFFIAVEVSCEAILGQTHCTEARIFPEFFCNEIDDNWSGATVQVMAECIVDSVRLRIENVSDFPMLQENGFVVTEDVIMLREGIFQLPAQESLTFTYPANGATYRLAAEQARFHPISNQPSISIEGCGGINRTGLVNAFPQDDDALNVSIDCQENIGSFDPNDKLATPSGWGEENFVAENTDLEYKIRFQNTGTDTAFTVVIVDTISTFLDAKTIFPGAASHAYTYQQYLADSTGLSIIQFTFEDILLPDSTTNLEGSNGFVKFKIAQQADLPNGVQLENKAAIFFDFNDPIITNIANHTIGEPFGRIISSTKNLLYASREIVVQPNPFSESTQISISGDAIKQGTLRLFNSLGQVARQQSFSGNQILLQRKNLQHGFYIYSIVAENQLIATGKIQLSED